MTFVETSLKQACVASGASGVGFYVYNGQWPSDKTWSVRQQVFPANGDRYQDALFQAVLYNNAIVGDDVAYFSHAARDWISPGNAHFSQTMSGHIGGTFTLKVYLTNPDFFSQCFWLWGNAGYQ